MILKALMFIPLLLASEEIRVVVASQTPTKLTAVERVFKARFPEVTIIGCAVDSNIPSQPIGQATAATGVTNRLNNIPLELAATADYTVAIESFIEESHHMWNDISLVSINGVQATSKATPISSYFVDLAREHSNHVSPEGYSMTVGEAIQSVYPLVNHHDWHVEEEFGGVSREHLIEEALFKALHAEELSFLKQQIVVYPDFPKEGILFEDFFPLLSNPESFARTINLLSERYKEKQIDVVIGLESRGFILAAALAYKLNAGFVPVRKPGKLPGEHFTVSYKKEYGTDRLCLSHSALKKNQRVLIIDDLIATGGSARAAIDLVQLAGANAVEFVSLLEIKELNGRQKLGIPSFNLLN